jgi:hypothetical protein
MKPWLHGGWAFERSPLALAGGLSKREVNRSESQCEPRQRGSAKLPEFHFVVSPPAALSTAFLIAITSE